MLTQLIAEIGQAHDGSLGILHSYIDALSETGIQTVKFQLHISEAESSEFEKFRIPFSYEDASRKAYWKRMEFSKDQWAEIKQHCEACGMEFLATPFSIAAVELLEELNVNRYKVGSGDITNLLLLDKIAQTRKPILLSSGMSNWEEIDTAIEYIKKYHTNISLLQCTTTYPCPPEQWGLELIPKMKARYQLPIGFSDHSGVIYSGIAAIAFGASILEFHVVFDKRMFGPDAKASLTIDEIKLLREGVEFLEKAMNSSQLKDNNEAFTELKVLFGKSLSTNKELTKGYIIQKGDLESKKPEGKGIAANEFEKVVGKKILRNLNKYEFINWSDIENA